MGTTIGYTFGNDKFFPSGRVDDRGEFLIACHTICLAGEQWGVTYFKRNRDSNLTEQNYDEDGISLYFNLGPAFGLGDGDSRPEGVRNQSQFQPGYAID